MRPSNHFVGPMLTDLYQLTMAYGYWKKGKDKDQAVFDLFFRKNPFGGEFTIFAGLEEVVRSLNGFRFTDADIAYLQDGTIRKKEELQLDFEAGLRHGFIRKRSRGFEELRYDPWGAESWEPKDYPDHDLRLPGPMRHCDPAFFDWLKSVDCSGLKIYAVPEGTMVFPRIPLIRVEGPLAVAQMQETVFLNLTGFPSLMATNAARFRLAAGEGKGLIEFGLRRAQGPDGGVSASRYSYIGGFNATSNTKAGQLFGLPARGTMAHSYVSSFSGLHEIADPRLAGADGKEEDFLDLVLQYRRQLGYLHTNEGELAAFVSYAQAFPEGFLALVDTYNTLKSGVPNFICVALALFEIGHKPVGIRLDSGDLSYFSKETRKLLRKTAERFSIESFGGLSIVASNDIDEAILFSLGQQGHEIDVFGIGTHLVTCRAQPALGCVYKLVSINGQPRMKLSDEADKMTVPGRKDVYRLVGGNRHPLVDLMIEAGKPAPKAGERILCRHPVSEPKRVYVVPKDVIALHKCVWDGRQIFSFPPLDTIRRYVQEQIAVMRPDHMRAVNPTPYKVSVSEDLYRSMHELWMHEAPITEIT
ncbi:MAG: nicotinate phosphoribosyltransferase [Deltaproteobacteria bacterium HGW-Deltaproteobacteria-21]|nr:MAG: nicotinate phosphoribosyltransferase [Deltaproteobacteria bacterium HGW-Deltaproteobacteria-21]